MTLVVISGLDRPVVVKASLTIRLAHAVGRAFTGELDTCHWLHRALEDASVCLCESGFAKYCVDMSGSDRYVLTFSRDTSPRVLDYRGSPARVARPDLTLELQEQEMTRVGRLSNSPPGAGFLGGAETER